MASLAEADVLQATAQAMADQLVLFRDVNERLSEATEEASVHALNGLSLIGW